MRGAAKGTFSSKGDSAGRRWVLMRSVELPAVRINLNKPPDAIARCWQNTKKLFLRLRISVNRTGAPIPTAYRCRWPRSCRIITVCASGVPMPVVPASHSAVVVGGKGGPRACNGMVRAPRDPARKLRAGCPELAERWHCAQGSLAKQYRH